MTSVLVTGAGTGFGREIALRLAERGARVVAGVEAVAQVAQLRLAAEERGVPLEVIPLDVTDDADRAAADGDYDVLVNNAGIAEGGAVVDIPVDRVRRQLEVNVVGPIELTQRIARRMVARRRGRIVFMSSVAGITTDPFTGAYSASKHAVEAFADALSQELAEFGVQVATINPGPFLTGFNDAMFETWRRWGTDAADRVFDYERIAFPHTQYDPEPVIARTVAVALGEHAGYRHVLPDELVADVMDQQRGAWDRAQPDGAARAELVQRAYDLRPGTTVDER